MDKLHRKRIIDSQRDAFTRHGYHPNALYWSNTAIQTLRFDYLIKIGIKTGDSVLDVGCGFGDLADYLRKQEKYVDYTGIDLSPELLKAGHERYPDISLLEGDLFDVDPRPASYDYVVLSGALNRDIEDNGKYAYKTITRMFETCRKGLAFNLLDARHEWTKSRWDLQSFYPEQMLKFVKKCSPNVQLYDNYLDNDFTILIWK